MTIAAGIDVGSGAVKAVVVRVSEEGEELLAHVVARIRRRDIASVVDDVFDKAVKAAGVDAIDYVATTGEGEDIPFATGHFYGMTTHARGALFLEPRARTVLDVGALHARVVAMDERGKVLNYRMTSRCASGSGQFLENIARYLGVSLSEVGELSMSARNPEGVSSICAVLAETDVINMVSRGIATEDILRGIHDSMAGRYARLLRYVKAEGTAFVSGGLANDIGLVAALADALDADKRRAGRPLELVTHPLSIHAGAIGAAIWGAFRHQVLGLEEAAWHAPKTGAASAIPGS
ncbi:MAG: benzoyl-CoA reductase subunit D [Deltaproteobacteria bacterium]|nr:benzoyl-CoA reductase subunit D [Deltaproteobacteria bacterium]